MKNICCCVAMLTCSWLAHGQYRPTILNVTPNGPNALVISIASYYPLKDAVDYFNYHYGWKISYEDPLYLESQLTDIAVPAWKKSHPGERGFYVPSWTELQFRVPKPTSNPDDRQKILDELVRQYNGTARLDKFSVQTHSNDRQTVIGSVLDKQVLEVLKLRPQAREYSGTEYLQIIVDQCSAQAPLPLVVGTVPVNALMHMRIPPNRNLVSCRSALEGLTEQLPSDSVYQLLEDIGGRQYIISLIPNSAYRPHLGK